MIKERLTCSLPEVCENVKVVSAGIAIRRSFKFMDNLNPIIRDLCQAGLQRRHMDCCMMAT